MTNQRDGAQRDRMIHRGSTHHSTHLKCRVDAAGSNKLLGLHDPQDACARYLMQPSQLGDAHARRILGANLCALRQGGVRWAAEGLAYSFRPGEARLARES
jgi:hypothetical protein